MNKIILMFIVSMATVAVTSCKSDEDKVKETAEA